MDSDRTCTKKYSLRKLGRKPQTWQLSWARQQLIESRTHTTGCWVRDLNNFLFTQPFKNILGELTGPIVTWADIPALVDSIKEQNTEENKMKAYNEFIRSRCQAAPINHRYYLAFEKAYESTILFAENHLLHRKQKQQQNSDLWKLRKQRVAERFILRLKSYMNNPKYFHLLTWRYNRLFLCKTINVRRQPPILMSTKWVQDYLDQYLSKPSSYSNNHIKSIAKNFEVTAAERYIPETYASHLITNDRLHRYDGIIVRPNYTGRLRQRGRLYNRRPRR